MGLDDGMGMLRTFVPRERHWVTMEVGASN